MARTMHVLFEGSFHICPMFLDTCVAFRIFERTFSYALWFHQLACRVSVEVKVELLEEFFFGGN